MAIQTITYNGTVNSNSQYISYYVVYELLSQNVGLNQSTVRATAYVKTGNWDFSSSNINKSITIDGQKTEQLHVSLNQGRNATTNLISLTKTITHKDDGTDPSAFRRISIATRAAMGQAATATSTREPSLCPPFPGPVPSAARSTRRRGIPCR